MDIKIGIIVVVLVLGVMWAGELMVLPAQNSTGPATQQTQSLNDTPEGKGSTQVPQDSVIQQTQSSKDAIDGEAPNGIRILGSIRLDPTINFGTLLNVILGFCGLIITSLSVVIAFLVFRRSKPPLELTSEEVSKPENANEVEGYIRAIERNSKASLIDKAVADAYVLQRAEKIEEAIEKWRSIANIAEGHDKALSARAWLSVGFLYVTKNMEQQALSALDTALSLKPDYARAYNIRGATRALLGKYQDALADYNKAIQLDPNLAEAYNNRGLRKESIGEHQDALADYNKAIQLKPDARVYANRGSLKGVLGKYQDALADYNKAIQLDSEFAEAYHYRGLAKAQLEGHQDVLVDYDKAIQLKPDYAMAYCSRAAEKARREEFEGTIADYTEVIHIEPSHAEAYTNRGAAKVGLNHIDEARSDFKIALELAKLQKNDNLKTHIEAVLQDLDDSTPQDNEN